MSARPIRIPGPDHPITIERADGRIVVTVAAQVIADTHDALILREASYPGVLYLPRKDVKTSLLQRTDHQTYCPYKGRSEEHTSELQSLMRISYAVFCLKKKKKHYITHLNISSSINIHYASNNKINNQSIN